MKSIDLTGKKFGRLTVLQFEFKKGRHKYWKCLCICGKSKIACGSNLRGGKTASCGCLRIEIGTARVIALPRTKFEPGVGSCNYLWNRYRQGAKKKGWVFDLSKDLFYRLTSSNCHYCGIPPALTVKGPRSNGEHKFNGIDRVDPSIGYTESNSVPACHWCNQAKLDYPVEEFMRWMSFIRSNP
jgi:hypothetical protein